MGIAKHFESGECLPEDVYLKLVAARTYRAGSLSLRQVSKMNHLIIPFFSAFLSECCICYSHQFRNLSCLIHMASYDSCVGFASLDHGDKTHCYISRNIHFVSSAKFSYAIIILFLVYTICQLYTHISALDISPLSFLFLFHVCLNRVLKLLVQNMYDPFPSFSLCGIWRYSNN